MDGLTLSNQLSQLLSEPSTSTWIDMRTTFDYLYEAACEFVRETQCLTNTQTIVPIATVDHYDLNPDYFFLFLTDDQNRFFVKFNDGTNDWMISHREYPAMTYGNQTTPQAIPDSFSIRDCRDLPVNLVGTNTALSTVGYNLESTLTDPSASFLTTVSVGDTIHNTSGNVHGVVLEVPTNTTVITAMFPTIGWSVSDQYVIIPQGRKELIFSPPFSASGGTITVEYVQRPTPVYSYYRGYRFNHTYGPAIVKYAAWLYKYRDREPQFADLFYKHWDLMLRRYKALEGKSSQRLSWKVNFNKRSWNDRSLR